MFYLDDILLLGRTINECDTNLNTTRELLESLGFVLNIEKCQLTPATECKFLGFLFNSEKLYVALPDDKRQKFEDIVRKFKNQSKCRIREMAHLVGLLVSACPGIKYASLYVKALEREKFLALHENERDYGKVMAVSPRLRPDFD